MNIWQKWNSISLVKRILVGLVIGAILGFCVPAGNEVIALLGDLFVGALKAVAPVLVFFLVISALANAKSAGSMGTVIVLYIVSTLVAALIAVCASYMFPTVVPMLEPAADQASPEGLGEVLTTLLMNVVANPVGALMNANYLGILAWGVVLGIALRAASQHTKDVFTAVSDAISKVVSWIISFAPIGILGLVYVAVSENRDLHHLWSSYRGVGGLHALHRARYQPAHRIHCYAQESLLSRSALLERFGHYRVLHTQLCGEHPGEHGIVSQARP